jgi:hypothetical protein
MGQYAIFKITPILGRIYMPFYYPELTTLRRENWKIGHENKILKENEPAPYV